MKLTLTTGHACPSARLPRTVPRRYPGCPLVLVALTDRSDLELEQPTGQDRPARRREERERGVRRCSLAGRHRARRALELRGGWVGEPVRQDRGWARSREVVIMV